MKTFLLSFIKSFADAEVLEDVLKHGVGRYLAYDVGEVVDALAEVLRDEVTGELHLQAVLHAVDGVEGVGEGFVVAGVGDDDVALRDVGQGGGFYKVALESVNAEVFLGGDEELGGIAIDIGLEQGFALIGGDTVGLIEEEEEEGFGGPT